MRRGLRAGGGAIALAAVTAAVLIAAPVTSASVSGAGFTTVNEAVDGTGHCQNGNPAVNCNIYDGKQFVWLNGGPSTAYVGDGSYFFAVLAPGGQADPNDGSASNLSSSVDAYTNRTFSVSGGTVSYGGSHDFDGNRIRLADYADTPNPGGVYIMAICSLANGYPVTPSSCKYDAFKVQAGAQQPDGLPLTITKDAQGVYTTTYGWSIAKSVDKTLVKQVGGSATFNYTVTVTHDAGTVSGVGVSGTISVFNPNADANGNTVPVDITGVTDQLSDGTVCTVTGGSSTLTQAKTDFSYSCPLAGLPQGSLDNTATVSWPDQFFDDGTFLAGSSADFTFKDISFAENTVDECASVSDSWAGALGQVCVGDSNPATFTYNRSIAVPRNGCLSYDNTATFTTNDTGTTGSDSKTVTVCGPARTGALTMGFWQNKNGQGIISGQAKTGVCPSVAWLRQYAPYQDMSSTATCSGVAGYVYNVVKAANASGSSMNAMLKAQMLATALDVYFSDPALGGNKISAPAPIGGVAIDLTMICKMIDGSSGTATCAASFQNVSSAFGGAASLTVSQMLAYAAGQSNVGGSIWYGNVKSVQELAKNAFDAINNGVAFAA